MEKTYLKPWVQFMIYLQWKYMMGMGEKTTKTKKTTAATPPLPAEFLINIPFG